MAGKRPSGVLPANRRHRLMQGLRKFEPALRTVVMAAEVASLIDGADRSQSDTALVYRSLARDGGSGWLQALRQR